MSRRRVIHRKKTQVDPKYNDAEVANFIARMMWKGKKSLSARILYSALDEIAKSVSDENPLDVFHAAIANVKPSVEVKSRRVGGSTYQIPVEVSENRQEVLAMRWIISAARKKKRKSMVLRLKDELLDAYNNSGSAVEKKTDIHRMAESNRAFAHYRWQ